MSKSYSAKEKVSDDLVKQLLANRGITDESEINNFLNPNFDTHLHDPYLLPQMEEAVDRIISAIKKEEKIGIWSDYDADGIPGGALLHDFFKLIGYNNFVNYIPDRHDEGYGLNSQGVQELADNGVKLLITIDCGVRDHSEIEHAKKLGMDVIVTDHHEPHFVNSSEGKPVQELPPALAIINHKRHDSNYPEQVLCGSGVVWKLIEAILKKYKPDGFVDGKEKWLLDLVGIATLSDMVPLRGENRALAHFGLKVLQKTRRPGLRTLYSMLKINSDFLSEDDIGFLITPRINAASRMGKPMDAFDLLVASESGEALALAKHLDSINNERKGIVAAMVKEAKKLIEKKIEATGRKNVIVLGNPDWRPSLLGLAANSLAEEYNMPVFLWGREGGDKIKGSCRSDGKTDLVAIMDRAKDSFEEFGGHKLSGGFAVKEDAIHSLEQSIIEASLHTSEDDIKIVADAYLKVSDVNENTAREISRLAPFGVGNDKPVFIFENIIPEKIEKFGKTKDHLSVMIRDGNNKTKAIGFFCSADSWGDCLKEGIRTNLLANIELSNWNGRKEVRLRIVDFF